MKFKRAPHEHTLHPVEVQQTGGLAGLFGAAATTIVLATCDCGMPVTKTLAGYWTLGQITGNPDDDVVDAEIIEAYPYTEGDTIVLGPECFIDAPANVISYRGDNYYRGPVETETGTANG